ncbi:MAG: hypothetical protein QNJ97_25155 [Myxococcota bacterium]|nr:hypothetical protein [Myxococcota bacterium]
MAAKKRRRTRRATTTTKKVKRNPRKSVAKTTYRRAKSALEKVNLAASLKKQPALVGGIFAAKFGANKFSDSGGDLEDWDMKAYLGAGLGAYVGGLLAENIKAGAGQKVLDAGLAYTLFKALRNELIGRSEWATKHFGQDELHPDYYEGEEYDQPGDVLVGRSGERLVLTDDGWREMDESDRMMGQAVVPASPVLGQAVVPADARLGADDSGGLFRRGARRSIWH